MLNFSILKRCHDSCFTQFTSARDGRCINKQKMQTSKGLHICNDVSNNCCNKLDASKILICLVWPCCHKSELRNVITEQHLKFLTNRKMLLNQVPYRLTINIKALALSSTQNSILTSQRSASELRLYNSCYEER